MAEKSFKNILLSVALCVALSSSTHTEDDDFCLKQTPCLCKLDDKRFIDISHIVSKDKPYLTVTTDKFSDSTHLVTPDKSYLTVSTKVSYFFYPCQDVKFSYKDMNLTVNGTDGCVNGTSLCMYDSATQTLVNLGTTKDVHFSSNTPKSLIFARTKPDVQSTILLACTPDIHETYLEPQQHLSGEHQLVLFSSYACVKTDEHGLSTGSTLLILFWVGFGVYLLGGAVVLHLLRGARGKEMIPNLDFWLDLPHLVQDGIVFLLSGCNPMSISTAETYDRI